MVADSGHDEIGAIGRYHRALCKSRARIMLLYHRVYTENRDKDT